jgi:hypothetical protein
MWIGWLYKRARLIAACGLVLAILTCIPRAAVADENGISVWLPGIYGSLAAAPQRPGWSLSSVYYHTSVSDNGSAAASREIAIGHLSKTVTTVGNVNLNADANLGLVLPNYVFATPVLGGQAAAGVMIPFGGNNTSVDGTLTIGKVNVTNSLSDSLFGNGDIFPQGSLRWNQGVNNFMIYGIADLPLGAYDSSRLANIGVGHWAIDGGAGYTYLNLKTGLEASAVTGLTYNFKNPSTDYQSGVDWHLDLGLSQFLSHQLHIGVVGYVYQQLTADSGGAPILGDFKSRVFGVGPQVGFVFPIGDLHGYLNLKGYKEFGAENRAEGWNAWLTLSISE